MLAFSQMTGLPQARRIGIMVKSKYLIAVLPALLALSGCSNVSPKVNRNTIIEDTLLHEEIFGGLEEGVVQAKKLQPNRLAEGEYYTPRIGFQQKQNNDGTYSVRFLATIENLQQDAVWTRSVHNLSGQVQKTKTTKNVDLVYSTVNDASLPATADQVEASEDGSHPFHYYAVYCLLNIPSSFSDYYVDAYLTISNDGANEKSSVVGSVNIADSSKCMSYSIAKGNRYVSEVNGVLRESDAPGNDHLTYFSAEFNANDKVRAYYIDKDNLSYTRYDYSNMERSNPDFEAGANNEISVKYPGTYNLFLNSSNQFSFQKKVYFQGPSWWTNNSADGMIEGKHDNEYNSYAMSYIEYSQEVHKYSAFIDISYYNEVQFFRRETGGNYNHTGFMNFPTDGKNCYTRYASELGGAWIVYGDDIPSNFTFNETELNTPQEIHTANQKAYLNFSNPYYHITPSDLTSFGASGRANNSIPNKVTVNWNYSVPTGRTVSKFSITYGQYADLSDGYEIDGTTTQSISFDNPYLGDNYFRITAYLDNGKQDASPIKVFKVDEQAPRNLSVGNMPNCRDMGGRTTYAGAKIKQGMIYRTAGNKFDNSTSVNTECKNVLRNQLGVKTEINVADSENNAVKLGGNVNFVNCYMDWGTTPYSNLSRNAESVRHVMEILADEDNYPVFYHCRIGTDRTGITGMMIGGLLGIPFNEVFQDYCFSNFAPIDGQRYPNNPNDTNGDDPAKYIDEILAMPGKNYQEQTYNALLSMGVMAETLNAIIDIMTVGPKAELPNDGIIGRDSNLSSSGTRRTSSDYKNPAVYYELSSGKNASLSATLTAGQKDIVVYLGSTDSSDSTKLASCISLKIDGVEQSIVDKTLFKSGFGTTRSSRTGYMFNLLGCYNLSAGQHTIAISVKSGTFYIGTICVFDHVVNTTDAQYI